MIVSDTYHTNNLAIELFVVGDHLSKPLSSPRHTFDQGAGDTATNPNGKDANVATLCLAGDVVKHLLLRPYVSVREKHEFSRKVLVTTLTASLDG